MDWTIYVLIGWLIILPVGVGAILWQHNFNNKKKRYSSNVAGYVTGTLLLIAMGIATLVPCIEAIGNHQTAVSCHNWGIANNRAAKYVVYNFWDTDCITPSGNGHWISTSDLTANNVTVNK